MDWLNFKLPPGGDGTLYDVQPSTKRQDEDEKPKLYASLGVEEYFQYDPTADYLNPQLRGSQLIDSVYQPLPLATTPEAIPYIHSQVLRLDLQLHLPYPALGIAPLPRALRFYDPETGTKLLNREEVEQVREALRQENALIQQERDAIQQERDSAQQERDAAQRRAEELAAASAGAGPGRRLNAPAKGAYCDRIAKPTAR